MTLKVGEKKEDKLDWTSVLVVVLHCSFLRPYQWEKLVKGV